MVYYLLENYRTRQIFILNVCYALHIIGNRANALVATYTAGILRREIQLNDIVYIESLNILGQVIQTARNQLKIAYKDGLNSYHDN